MCSRMVTTQAFLCDLHDYKLNQVNLRLKASSSCYGTEFSLNSTLYVREVKEAHFSKKKEQIDLAQTTRVQLPDSQCIQERSFPIYKARPEDALSSPEVTTTASVDEAVWDEALKLGSFRSFGLGGWYAPKVERTVLMNAWNFVDQLVQYNIPVSINNQPIDHEVLEYYRSLRQSRAA